MTLKALTFREIEKGQHMADVQGLVMRARRVVSMGGPAAKANTFDDAMVALNKVLQAGTPTPAEMRAAKAIVAKGEEVVAKMRKQSISGKVKGRLARDHGKGIFA